MRARGWCGAVVALALAAGPAAVASAQSDPAVLDPEEAMEQAREAFAQGRRAYAREQFSEALAAFRRAHRLTASPDLLFHIGAAADRLGLVEDALAAYQEFVRLRPSAPERQTADGRIAVLEAAVADPDANGPSPPADAPDNVPAPGDPDPEDGPDPDLRLPPMDADPHREDGGGDGGPGAGPFVLVGVGAAAVVGGTVALVLGADDGASDVLTPLGGALVGVGAAALIGGILWAIFGGAGDDDGASGDVDGARASPRPGTRRIVQVRPTPTGLVVVF